ncbi:hypothetical protein ABEB36_006678 [Hypothenemus hampei]|uniref:C3H1-type domain-containing protein n=1 Tax=Hypothenemus hampei TaxID=57062 RepID=A0ABD1ERE0_HYPHA
MPVVESEEESRSGSSSNESDNEYSDNRPRSPDSPRSNNGSPNRPPSPRSGPHSPDNQRSIGSRSRSHTPKSQSGSPRCQAINGPRSPPSDGNAGYSSPEIRRSRSASSSEGSNSPSRPSTPKSRVSPSNLKLSREFRGPRSPEPVTSKKSDSEDNASVKSKSSRGSRKLKARSSSRSSSRGSRKRRQNKSGSDSDSSISSVDSSSRKNKDISRAMDTNPEDISDGDMESDNEKPKLKSPKNDLKISHEDLSDVSDLEDSIGGNSDDENKDKLKSDLDASQDHAKKDMNAPAEKKSIDSLNTRPDDGEEQLDFEAEDGECDDVKSKDGDKDEKEEGEEDTKESATKEEKELEEGEVSDEDDPRPEETEPRPVCRFFSRGACTWGASCRFLHPGVTDKGNYTMFDMVRPMLPGEYGMGRMMDDRMYKPEPPLVESAWERGLRTAKEMLKKSIRRKEQDIDFEEKKMNLSIAQEEFDKENGYYGRIPSPEPRYVRHIPEYTVSRPPPEEYYGRRPMVFESEYPVPRREHAGRSYREMPAPRGPPPEYYSTKYEEEPPPRALERAEGRERERERERRKPKREVIVQRAEKEERPTRADEWQDPWMRSKSPGRRKDRKRSYSSGSSCTYSSSSSRSSSPSSKSSYRSQSRSTYRSRSKQKVARQVSPSVIVSERKAANERAALMNPPAPKRRVPSPGMMRVSAAANPPAPSREETFNRNRSKLAVVAALAKVKGKTRRSSRSSSGSSSGSSSESDSSESSSESSSRSLSPPLREVRKPSDFAKAIDVLKGSAIEKNKIKLNLKNPPGVRKQEPIVKKRTANSPPPGEAKAKKSTSRREELLKQLKAVEDAIAKKKSKV